MNKKYNILLLLILLCSFAVTAQVEKEYNPFQSIGKKGKIVTLTKGKYVEVFDYDSIQRIGSVMYNIRTKTIVALLDPDSTFEKFSDNSSASRWYAPDPLAEKGRNISYSPYTYTFNNPINYTDPDGQDGVRIVDNKNKTITIRAIYFVQSQASTYDVGGKSKSLNGYSDKEISSMQSSYNKYLNGLGMKVSEGDYKDYSVKFDFEFKAGGSAEESRTLADNEKQDGLPIGNSFIKENDKMNPRFATVEKDDANGDSFTQTVGGTTENHKYIDMNNKEDTKMNRIHEIFHTLGLSHPKGSGSAAGIMKYPPEKPTQKDINTIGNSSFLPVIQIPNPVQ